MSQYDFGDLESPLPGASFINGNLEPWRDALHTCHKGSARPSYAQTGMLWIDDSADPDWLVKIYDGTQDVTLGTLDSTTHVFTPSGVTAPTADNVSFDPTGTDFTGTDVQAALEDLDSAAFEPTSSFATAAQGSLADTALQPGEATPQVWYEAKTDTATIAAQTWTDISGLSITVPAGSADDDYMVEFVGSASSDVNSTPAQPVFRLMRDSTVLEQADAAGSRIRGHAATARPNDENSQATTVTAKASDSPNTTSAITYKVQWRRSGTSGTAYLNRSDADFDGDNAPRLVSTLHVTKVRIQ